MQTLIQRAQKGNCSAMTSLFDQSKSRVMFLCQVLLADEKSADNAVTTVYKRLWEDIVEKRIGPNDDFTDIAIHKAVVHCKARLTRKNKKAFRIPANLNFAVSFDADKMYFYGDTCETILYNLPALHRFIYILHGAFNFSDDEIGKLLSLSPKAIQRALEAESQNIDRIVTIAIRKTGAPLSINTGSFHKELLEKLENTPVPNAVLSVIDMSIQNVCAPVQKKCKRIKIQITSAAIAFVAVISIIVCISIATENASSDISSDTDAGETGDVSEENDGAADSDITSASEITPTHYAYITIQDYDTITVALDGNSAPETVENFVSLAESGFYDGLTFHRIIDGFMMQGGDPNGDGTGGAENTITGEFSENGYENGLSHTRGAISMARSEDYNSASSQFFIVQEDHTELDGNYAVFGYVTDGMDIVDSICSDAEPTDDNGTINSDQQPIITSITVAAAENTDVSTDAA